MLTNLTDEMANGSSDETSYAALQAIISAVSSSSSEYILSSFRKLLADQNIAANVGTGILDYMLAAGLLSFAGREIDRKSLSRVVKAVGITPDPKMVDILITTGIKSHLIYLYAYYFLVAGRTPVSEQKMMDVVDALGLKPDRDRAAKMLALLS